MDNADKGLKTSNELNEVKQFTLLSMVIAYPATTYTENFTDSHISIFAYQSGLFIHSGHQ